MSRDRSREPRRRHAASTSAAAGVHVRGPGARTSASTPVRGQWQGARTRASRGLGPGPSNSIDASEDWSDIESRWAHCPAAPIWAGRLRRKLEIGLDITSHYSGTGAAEVAFAKIAGDRMVSYSACDVNKVCQDVLLHHSVASAPRHVFADLCDRPPGEVMERLRRRLKEVQAEAGISSAAPGSASTPASASACATALGRRWVREAMAILATWTPTRDDQSVCVRHGCQCQNFPPRTSRYHVEVSGVNCQPWSAAGRRRGWLDDRSLPCLVLVRTILCIQPNRVCIECTPNFDVEMLETLLEEAYVGAHVITCPSDFGVPVFRRRLYMWFDLKSSLDEVHLDMTGLLFASCRRVVMSPKCYVSATTPERRAYYMELWSRQHGGDQPLPTGSVLRRLTAKAHGPLPQLEQLLSGGLLQRYHDHRARAETQNLTSSQCIVVDINQNADYRRALRDMVPTLMRSTVLVLLFADAAQDCLFTPGELVSIHGLDISPQCFDA